MVFWKHEGAIQIKKDDTIGIIPSSFVLSIKLSLASCTPAEPASFSPDTAKNTTFFRNRQFFAEKTAYQMTIRPLSANHLTAESDATLQDRVFSYYMNWLTV